jgi:hypothetical protein
MAVISRTRHLQESGVRHISRHSRCHFRSHPVGVITAR